MGGGEKDIKKKEKRDGTRTRIDGKIPWDEKS